MCMGGETRNEAGIGGKNRVFVGEFEDFYGARGNEGHNPPMVGNSDMH